VNLLFIAVAIIAGGATALQVAVNAQAGKRLELHFLQAALINFGVGTLTLLVICMASRFAWPALGQVRSAPWWIWCGGLLGILYVAASVVLGVQLGTTLFLTLVVAGQMVGSLVIDEFGLLGMPIRTANVGRVLGVVLVIVGVILVARSTPNSAHGGAGDPANRPTSVEVTTGP